MKVDAAVLDESRSEPRYLFVVYPGNYGARFNPEVRASSVSAVQAVVAVVIQSGT